MIKAKTQPLNFEQFCLSDYRNLWIKEPGIDLYVRKSIHKDVNIDLANMVADKPGTGALTEFLDKYEPKFGFYVENAHPRLAEYFKRRGYEVVRIDGFGGICLKLVKP
jgi:hypothetical protein